MNTVNSTQRLPSNENATKKYIEQIGFTCVSFNRRSRDVSTCIVHTRLSTQAPLPRARWPTSGCHLIPGLFFQCSVCLVDPPLLSSRIRPNRRPKNVPPKMPCCLRKSLRKKWKHKTLANESISSRELFYRSFCRQLSTKRNKYTMR